mmetsp:Transcript_40608/g.105420  ORF Transcript_40608/g.105420 Transcript_40608/m.105420 type:complete len:82 (+) Transcript_40608:650-895(+)
MSEQQGSPRVQQCNTTARGERTDGPSLALSQQKLKVSFQRGDDGALSNADSAVMGAASSTVSMLSMSAMVGSSIFRLFLVR